MEVYPIALMQAFEAYSLPASSQEGENRGGRNTERTGCPSALPNIIIAHLFCPVVPLSKKI
jgi:hypothetical protein